MFKKMISNALLSVVMDKSARDTLEFKKKIHQVGQTLAAEQAASVQPAAPASRPEEDGIPDTPLPQTPDPGSSLPDPMSSLTHEETRQLIVDSLKAAEEELGAQPQMSTERQALIGQALEIHKSKEHILDALSEEQRQKLQVLALHALKGDPASIVAPKESAKKKLG
jgi:hypothetical protein